MWGVNSTLDYDTSKRAEDACRENVCKRGEWESGGEGELDTTCHSCIRALYEGKEDTGWRLKGRERKEEHRARGEEDHTSTVMCTLGNRQRNRWSNRASRYCSHGGYTRKRQEQEDTGTRRKTGSIHTEGATEKRVLMGTRPITFCNISSHSIQDSDFSTSYTNKKHIHTLSSTVTPSRNAPLRS